MRIEAIRIDGYGIHSGLEIKDLPPGLTVVAGPNEAGKTTILDFIRGVLFDFPRSSSEDGSSGFDTGVLDTLRDLLPDVRLTGSGPSGVSG